MFITIFIIVAIMSVSFYFVVKRRASKINLIKNYNIDKIQNEIDDCIEIQKINKSINKMLKKT